MSFTPFPPEPDASANDATGDDGLVLDLLNPLDVLPGVKTVRLYEWNLTVGLCGVGLGLVVLVQVLGWFGSLDLHFSHPDAYAESAPHEAQPSRHSAYFKDCAEARLARATPLISGATAYRSGLDDDGDGIGCEAGEVGAPA